MMDIPSRSFGSIPQWHFRTDALPNKQSWTVFQPSFKLGMHVISILQMQRSMLDDWWGLLSPGNHVGIIGNPISHLWWWILIYRIHPLQQKVHCSQVLHSECKKGIMDEDAGSALTQCVQRSRPLARRSHWPMEKTPPRRSV